MIRKIRLSSERFRELVSLVSEKSVIRGAREVFYDKSDSVTPRRKESDWILDFRRTFLDSKGITLLSEIFWDIYGDVPEFQIATVELWSVPLSWGILLSGALRSKDVSALIVRKSRKKDGLANIIEGVPLKGVSAILVDDLVNSGDSLLRALEILRAAGIRVARIFCVFSFLNPDFLKKFAQFWEGIELSYLLDPSDLGLVVGRKNEDVPTVLFPKRKTLFESKFFHKTLVVPKSSPAVSDGKAFFAGEHGEVRSVDVTTGEEFWKFAMPATPAEKNILSSVVETPDSIVFGAYDGALYALGKTDGKIRFRTSVADWIGSTPAYDPRDGAFFIGLEHFWKMAGSIIRTNRNGEPEWNVPVPDFVHSSPIFLLDSDRVICGTNGGELFCLRGSDGFELWKKSFSAPIKAGFCFVPETDSVCFGAFDGNFYCVSAKDGSERWKIRTPHIVYSTPAYRDGSVFFWGADGIFRHLDAKTGEILFSFRTGGRIFSQPSFFRDSHVVFGSNDMRVYFYRPKIRKMSAYVQHHERITTRIAFSGNAMIVEDFSGSLFHYDLSDVAESPRRTP